MLGIIFSAFIAHALKNSFLPHQEKILQTAFLYLMIHSVMLVVGSRYLKERPHSRTLRSALLSWFLGIILFSGSLYLLAFTEQTTFGIITPFGGVSLIVGWILLARFFAREPTPL